ncbi:MAG: DUF4199 domain-containing protein [Bergeyella sp.]|nr:DUF4199 domain-containing protein [Bergeyella sp.]
MLKNPYLTGLFMGLVILLIFFFTNFFLRDTEYYRRSVMLSSFLLPLIYLLGALSSVSYHKKKKKDISFREAFGSAFLPMFLGGFLSMSIIYIYINDIDSETKSLLNHQYIESYKNALEEEYSKANKIVKPNSEEKKELDEKYKEAKMRIQEKMRNKEDMFSFRYFFYVFSAYCMFFLMLSVFLGAFFRGKKTM